MVYGFDLIFFVLVHVILVYQHFKQQSLLVGVELWPFGFGSPLICDLARSVLSLIGVLGLLIVGLALFAEELVDEVVIAL